MLQRFERGQRRVKELRCFLDNKVGRGGIGQVMPQRRKAVQLGTCPQSLNAGMQEG